MPSHEFQANPEGLYLWVWQAEFFGEVPPEIFLCATILLKTTPIWQQDIDNHSDVIAILLNSMQDIFSPQGILHKSRQFRYKNMNRPIKLACGTNEIIYWNWRSSDFVDILILLLGFSKTSLILLWCESTSFYADTAAGVLI